MAQRQHLPDDLVVDPSPLRLGHGSAVEFRDDYRIERRGESECSLPADLIYEVPDTLSHAGLGASHRVSLACGRL